MRKRTIALCYSYVGGEQARCRCRSCVQGECAVLPVACTMDVAGLARWATCVFARAGWFEDSHDFVVAVFRDGRFLVAIWFETRGSWCLH